VRPIFRAYPGLADTLPIVPLAELPTPLNRLPRFSEQLNADIWIKHDELTGELYGGNKVRKLEFLLADALEQGCTDVITYGAAGSNHALASSIYAQQHGLRCHVVITDQPDSPKVGKTLRYHLQLGTHLVHAGNYPEVLATAAEITQKLETDGRRVYDIPFGGSSALGTIGFVNAALELAEQIVAGDMPEPDRIYLACGTSGSVTGLSLGLRLAGIGSQIIATQVTPPAISGPAAHCRLFNDTNLLLHTLDNAIPLLKEPRSNVMHRDDEFGAGYAHETASAADAVQLIARLEDVHLETTYTGKALAALVKDSETGTTLFWNTYNAQPYKEAGSQASAALPPELQKYIHNN
tara:strand:+ start:1046 stop:2098 length:1053 start_codon:yes stop_codon:yes gene_type:complete